MADTGAVTTRSMAVALHGIRRLSTLAFRPGLGATRPAGACPYGVKARKAGSVPMPQALHSHRPRSTPLAKSLETQAETSFAAL